MFRLRVPRPDDVDRALRDQTPSDLIVIESGPSGYSFDDTWLWHAWRSVDTTRVSVPDTLIP